MIEAPLLSIEDLTVEFTTHAGTLRAVDGISLSVGRGRTLGIVGESGCGKTVTSLAVMRLLPEPPARIGARAIRFAGEDLLKAPPERLRDIRGRDIAMIFQEPMTSLNPAFTVGEQIGETLIRHRGLSPESARQEAIQLMTRVGIPDAKRRAPDYPHKLSGGLRQRVMIAMALACNPKLLIADEPTTALDVTIQAQILDLLRRLKKETGMALMLITHDLGVVAEMADDVAVMYAGKIVERGAVADIFRRPQHPYTVGLLGAIPSLTRAQTRLATIEGGVPNPAAPPSGCRFHPRCPFAEEACRGLEPALAEIDSGHWSACRRAPLERNVLGEAA